MNAEQARTEGPEKTAGDKISFLVSPHAISHKTDCMEAFPVFWPRTVLSRFVS